MASKNSKTRHKPAKSHTYHAKTVKTSYKDQLLEVDDVEAKYDKLFEQKLSEQYREFRNLKEHHMQTRKFLQIVAVLITIMLLVLLIFTYSS